VEQEVLAMPAKGPWDGDDPRARLCRRQPITTTLAALVLCGLLGACSNDGGSNDGDASASSDHDLSAEQDAEFETASEFAACMRDHGIEGFPDPQVSDSSFILVGLPLADRRDADEMNAAQEACQHILDDAAPPDETDADAAAWERVVPGGNCQCADGSEFSFWVRKANPEKVVLYLQDGGACFSAETCAPESDLYNTSIGSDNDPGQGGMFDFADERNPFADYSVVFVPYCTGDVHIGNATTEYAPGLTVHHNGYVNGTAALDHLAVTFPGATEVVVIGESAGAIASPLYAGLVSDRLPDARITVLADGSGAYPDVPAINDIIVAWGAGKAILAWPENAGLTAEHWSFPGLFIQSGRHDPDIVFARHDYAYDEKQEFFAELAGIPAQDLVSLIDGNETQIEGARVNLLSYIAPGDGHTVFSDGPFYTEGVNGQLLVDWVTRLIAGEPVDDVHCAECTAG
jgi:Pectinacetylesterase